MKQHSLAIAVTTLLVAGMAFAAFHNNQAPQQRAVAAASDADDGFFRVQPDGDQRSGTQIEPMPLAAAQSPAFAEVLNVEPLREDQRLYATVLSTDPVRESNTVNTPREVCEDVVVNERLPERDGNVGGTVAGAVIGGLVGNRIGKGNGRKAATVGGAVAGGFIGNRIDRNHVGGQVVQRVDRQCRTVMETSTDSRVVAYNVTYRNPDGSTGSMRSNKRPGERIALGSTQKTVGYQVTYELDGEQHSVRMDHDPGQWLPVVDGQVVTERQARPMRTANRG